MKRLQKNTLIPLLLVVATLVMQLNFGSMKFIPTTGFKHEKPIVIFDVAHQQYFNHTHMQEALQMVEDQYGIDVYLNKENFTLTNLRGADLLILPSPYFQLPASEIVTPFDQQVLIEFLGDGGSILFLSNPFFFEKNMRNFSGHNTAMDRFMNIGTALAFSGAQNVLMDDFNYQYNDERFLSLNSTYFQTDHAIITGFPEDEPVEELLAYSTGIGREIPGELVVNTPSTTYKLDSEGTVEQGSVYNHTIIASSTSGGNGRTIACGSAIMFSDLVIPSTNSTRWIDVKDNKQLFKNMVSWLLFETPVPEEVNYIPDFSLFAFATSVLFLLTFVIGIILYTVGREVKRVEVSEKLIKMREQRAQKEKIDKEIQEALYAEDVPEEDKDEEKEEEEIADDEIDMDAISEEVRKKSKTRSRSERRQRRK
ncbi:MAG: hypothetical protein GF308_14965 [Candidatus Heimdallarchaeota archaeon]|nr:hypothetical protein [Candidatus Heimdallarchaeota archaeon]